ncbi:hypothetical protein [Methylococcus geothermalis]|uniref:Lipoprotein n=1 Tax=Methylococcus geothermalis TaxID=2681310 RepID=A0A858Q641_9GAMM|nr:hypothetical protein [Methylococcus geothermalis]QJD29264.1 hypothetical protein GNH96_04310 [Methylococcus geothermalis]
MDQDKAFHRTLAGLAATAVLLAGCGSETPEPAKTSAPAATTSSAPSAPPHIPVTQSEHQIFEKLYVEKCIKGQQNDPDNLVKNDQELGRVCECMAKEISQRISKAEAVHFNQKGEFPFDLVIMSNQAANHCLGSP